MTRNYPDLGSASHWLNQISHEARPIRSTTQIWVVTRHQYEISAPIFQRSFDRETSGSVAECRLFSQAIIFGALLIVYFSSLVVQTFHANKKYHEKESKGKIERILRCRYVIRSNYGLLDMCNC